jgi:hypothetical protein
MTRTECPDTTDGLSATGAADTPSLFRGCPSACPPAVITTMPRPEAQPR